MDGFWRLRERCRVATREDRVEEVEGGTIAVTVQRMAGDGTVVREEVGFVVVHPEMAPEIEMAPGTEMAEVEGVGETRE